MTTIAYKDGVMAADSRAYAGDKVPLGSKVKIRRLKGGTLLGSSTTVVGGGEKVLNWYENGMKAEDELPETFQLLVAKKNGEVFYSNDTGFLSGPLEAHYFAIGSGEHYAIGAFLMGACAVDAIRASCQADIWTGLPIYAASHTNNVWRVDS